ncbi:MAG: sulfurtransferase TusA family protein [Candidatus Marinimicrobia bacterium]|jgi:tRNA 2-thiouridine synthesizing protein A|nr:sulfurtransferase TusA family protein [Candidatus Neomarinimicrobiota bacterium]MBT4359563.1 sulfurtransferase TusA family protein [Candidatus Neomarinimicrobiota bacterium]MBT4714205.1 sulfurtransferase TusA family protein [Candidatus Neomarinimicrobiota bacterium]MBT4945539.1 sulfurtransferase TusA family protein [Candidatus Neomarinimicrobiota bacterium]MBT5314177.1 sulfurtransferase TusA family protein [Candidatus Neomarinimicrobiota bacterium]
MNDQAYDQELDCKGMNCPLPILKTKKQIDTMGSGEVLKMIATDPGSINDMTSWTKRTGNELLSHSQDGGDYVFFIKKT